MTLEGICQEGGLLLTHLNVLGPVFPGESEAVIYSLFSLDELSPFVVFFVCVCVFFLRPFIFLEMLRPFWVCYQKVLGHRILLSRRKVSVQPPALQLKRPRLRGMQ